MARPEEKAQAMLNKWVKMRDEDDPTSLAARRANQNQKRPHLASLVEHLADAEKFRMQIIREISEGVKKIQNPGLGEHAIRDLNDGINKLIREKWHWNRRIKELGGKDYNKEERKAMLLAEQEGGVEGLGGLVGGESDGLGLKGSGGYRYFGAAKDLPGVKELFARHAAKMTKRKRGDIYKYITPDYYGLRDEEDGVLLELEGKMAVENRKKLKKIQEDFAHLKEDDHKPQREQQQQGYGKQEGDTDDSSVEDLFSGGLENGVAAHEAVPSQEIVSQMLLEKKRKDLLSRFL
ncbi:hypothetical protein ACHAXS_013823 [Conticribra weissflogii]